MAALFLIPPGLGLPAFQRDRLPRIPGFTPHGRFAPTEQEGRLIPVSPAGPGLETGYRASKARVLPLDDPAGLTIILILMSYLPRTNGVSYGAIYIRRWRKTIRQNLNEINDLIKKVSIYKLRRSLLYDNLFFNKVN